MMSLTQGLVLIWKNNEEVVFTVSLFVPSLFSPLIVRLDSKLISVSEFKLTKK